MELKTFFAQDSSGNTIANPSVSLFLPGTTTLATGLQNAAGATLANPFTGTVQGQIVVAAPDGEYDIKVDGLSRSTTMRLRFNSTAETATAKAAEAAASALAAEKDRAAVALLKTATEQSAEDAVAAKDAAELAAQSVEDAAESIATMQAQVDQVVEDMDDKAPKAFPAFTGTVSIGDNWSFLQEGTDLIFKHDGVKKMKLSSTGDLSVVGDLKSFQTL